MPRVSVLMPNYNHGAYLKESLGAILSQSFRDFEVIVVDDASTDESVSIITQMADLDPRLRLFRHKKNEGPVIALNYALEMAQGEYLVFAAADDKVLPAYFEKMMEVLLSCQDISMCVSDNGYFFENETLIRTHKLTSGKRGYFTPKEALRLFQKSSFFIPGHTTVVKRDLVKQFGGFNPHFGYLTDWVMLHSIALKNGFFYLPETLAAWRKHEHCFSKKMKKKEIYFHFLNHLDKDKELKRLFFDSSLLLFIFRSLPFSLLISLLFSLFLKPKYWNLFPPVIWKGLFLVKRKLL